MLDYEEMRFSEEEDFLRVRFYDFFYADIPKEEVVKEIGDYSIEDDKILSKKYSEERMQKHFMRLFTRYKTRLTYSLNGNKAVFVDEELGLPLIGLQFLGIMDKGSEMIEIKPITNCNTSCVFCSVNEGPGSDKEIDFVVDKDFLVNETKELLRYKDCDNMSLWINPHGEPTLYPKLGEFIEDMLEDEHVKDVHVVTNGVLLGEKLVDELALISKKAGKEVIISLSLSAKGCDKSKEIMGDNYNIDAVLKNVKYAIKKLTLVFTPVLVHGVNDDEIKNIVLLAKELGVKVSIQKFCKNKRGKNPVKEQSWDDFYKQLKLLEEETGCSLTSELGKLQKTKELDAVCKKGDKVNVRVVCPGRYSKDKIGVLETPTGSRGVALVNCSRESGTVKGTVIKNKSNIAMVKTKC